MRKWLVLIALMAPLCGCLTASTSVKESGCPPTATQLMWGSDGQHWYNADEKEGGQCQMNSETRGQIILAVVAGTIALGIIIPIIVWVATKPQTGGGSTGGCPKCKKTKVRSDGVVQSYWVCC